MGNFADLERLNGRIGMASAGGRDLRALHDSLLRIPPLKELLATLQTPLLRQLTEEILALTGSQARVAADRCLVPVPVREPILNEVSGEQAQLHVQFLAANRDRQAAEYQDQYFETTYIRDMAKQYGLSDVQVDFFPTRDAWDAEEGDLWLVQPRREKIASIAMAMATAPS